MNEQWKQNNHGRYYKPGVGDSSLWMNIVKEYESNPTKGYNDIAKRLRCSVGLVGKVLKIHQSEGEIKPKVHGAFGNRPHDFQNAIPVVQDYLNQEQKVRYASTITFFCTLSYYIYC